jgi:hypothetical protein
MDIAPPGLALIAMPTGPYLSVLIGSVSVLLLAALPLVLVARAVRAALARRTPRPAITRLATAEPATAPVDPRVLSAAAGYRAPRGYALPPPPTGRHRQPRP